MSSQNFCELVTVHLCSSCVFRNDKENFEFTCSRYLSMALGLPSVGCHIGFGTDVLDAIIANRAVDMTSKVKYLRYRDYLRYRRWPWKDAKEQLRLQKRGRRFFPKDCMCMVLQGIFESSSGVLDSNPADVDIS